MAKREDVIAGAGREGTIEYRLLVAADLDSVVAIDRAITGRSRRGFYEKRLAAIQRDPSAFIALGAAEGGHLVGFAFAQLLDGEFGGKFPVALLDAFGIASGSRGRGAGRGLMRELETMLRGRGARELQSQAPWTNHELLRFFAATGFTLAPRQVLERAATTATTF